jgi:hypothetical protein
MHTTNQGGGIAEGETNNQHFFNMVKAISMNEGPRIQKSELLKCLTQIKSKQ